MMQKADSLKGLISYHSDSESDEEKIDANVKPSTPVVPTTIPAIIQLSKKPPLPKQQSVLPLITGDSDDDEDEKRPVPIQALQPVEGGPLTVDPSLQEVTQPLPGHEGLMVMREKYEAEAVDEYTAMRLLPPEPPGEPNKELQDHIKKLLQKARDLKESFNQNLQSQKDFHNPYILNKIARLYKINQTATNYPPELYNPNDIKLEDTFEVIAHQQLKWEKQKEEEKKKRTSLDFVPPENQPVQAVTALIAPLQPAATSAPPPPKNKKAAAQAAAAKIAHAISAKKMDENKDEKRAKSGKLSPSRSSSNAGSLVGSISAFAAISVSAMSSVSTEPSNPKEGSGGKKREGEQAADPRKKIKR